MPNNTIIQIEERLKHAGTLNDATRNELLSLLGELKKEISGLGETHGDQAKSIAGFAQVSAHEATRDAKNPDALKHSIGGLEASVSEFEQSHPQLVAAANRICTALSNLGI